MPTDIEIQLNLIQAKTNRLQTEIALFCKQFCEFILCHSIQGGKGEKTYYKRGVKWRRDGQKILQLNKSLKSGHSKSGHTTSHPSNRIATAAPIVRRRGKFINNNSMPTQAKHNASEYLGHNLMSTLLD